MTIEFWCDNPFQMRPCSATLSYIFANLCITNIIYKCKESYMVKRDQWPVNSVNHLNPSLHNEPHTTTCYYCIVCLWLCAAAWTHHHSTLLTYVLTYVLGFWFIANWQYMTHSIVSSLYCIYTHVTNALLMHQFINIHFYQCNDTKINYDIHMICVYPLYEPKHGVPTITLYPSWNYLCDKSYNVTKEFTVSFIIWFRYLVKLI